MKKWMMGVTGLVIATMLAGCSVNSTVASMKGAKITKDEFYTELKGTANGQAALRSMIVLKALEQQYGDKVSDKKVNKQYDAVKKQYGDSFSAALEQNGLTTKTFRDQIKTSLLSSAALKDYKKPTKAQLDKQWAKYQPKITVQHILVAKKEKADELVKDLEGNNTEAHFKELAKKNSTDTSTANNGGMLPKFDNTDTSLDATFREAAFKLKKAGDFTKEPVKTSYGYHIIRAVKIPEKGKMKDHTKELTDQIYAEWESDTDVMTGIIKKVLKKANVVIKDAELKNVLSVYLGNASSSSKSSSMKSAK